MADTEGSRGYQASPVPCMDEAKAGEDEDVAEEQGDVAEGAAATGASGGTSEAATADGDVPEMMDLIDTAEESGEDIAALTSVLQLIQRRIRATPKDRDMLTDFDAISNICKALANPPHSWQGEAMVMFCKIMPDVCRTSNINRGTLRDEGFLTAAVELLRSAVARGDEPAAIAGCLALSATCTANDGNKKVVAQLAESTPDKPGGMLLCLDALGRFPASASLQTEAICALRACMTDDDPRKASCDPSALENREVALSDEGFPFLGIAVQHAFDTADKAEKPLVRLLEQTLLLLREMARRQDFVKALAINAKLLPRVQAALLVDDPRVVRAALAVLRAFCSEEEVRDEIGLLSDCACQCIVAVHKHIATPVVCEQGFGLFANLTIRKTPIAAKLNEGERGIVTLAQDALRLHLGRPDVARSVVQTVRNIATQDEAASAEVKETDIFEFARSIVKDHEGDSRWHGAVDISRQFLREFRADAGMEKKAVYNQFY